MIAVDTNLLIYAHRAGTPEHRRARKAIERAAASPLGWGVTMPSVAEFWSVVTHQETPKPSRLDEAKAFIEVLVRDAGCQLLIALPGSVERVLHFAVVLDLRGPRIFDLQIAVVAQQHGAIEMWTHDAGFVTLPGLAVIDPLR